MLDPKIIRSDPERIRRAILDKGESADLDSFLELDGRRRAILAEVELKKAERNRAGEEIARAKKAGEDADEILTAMKDLSAEIKRHDEELREVDHGINALMLWIPNIPHESVPIGADADSNVEVRRWGDLPDEKIEAIPHWDIGAALSLFDLERAAKVSGSGFVVYTGLGSLLQRALIQMMLDLHVAKHGYREVTPPYLTRADAMEGTGQLPKLKDDMYATADGELYLIPTGEVPITNLYRGEELNADDLPIKLVGHSACFRREAGAAGRDTRGLVRIHQFDKVEMVKFVHPDQSYAELEKLVEDAEDVLKALELPYRVLTLASGDLSFAAAKCYDLEVWAPAEKRWLEVSSCSNFESFQARRIGIRFRNERGRLDYVHTLNGSGLALPRVVAAILELFQNEDGSVSIPEALRSYMGGREKLTPS